jgi:hypothetical protein
VPFDGTAQPNHCAAFGYLPILYGHKAQQVIGQFSTSLGCSLLQSLHFSLIAFNGLGIPNFDARDGPLGIFSMMPPIPFPETNFSALPAHSRLLSIMEFSLPRICIIKWMAIHAMCLPCMNSSRPMTARFILFSRYSFQMIWVDTAPHATEMVDLQSIRYSAAM